MTHSNTTYTASRNGHSNGKNHGTAPLPSTNRIAQYIEAAFRPTKNEEAVVKRIAELWRSYQHRGLEIRHMIGKLLNQQIGNPDDRQDRGKAVMAMASERLGIAVSDLNRMRWFAFLFKSVKGLHEKHPKIDSWTKLKEELPRLMPKDNNKKKKPPKPSPAARFVREVGRSIQGLTKAIKRNRATVPTSEQTELLKQLRELAAVVTTKLNIRVTVSQPRDK